MTRPSARSFRRLAKGNSRCSTGPARAVVAAACLSAGLSVPATSQEIAPLAIEDGWRIRASPAGENLAAPGLRDDSWAMGDLGDSWEEMGLRSQSGPIWFRRTIDVPEELLRPPGGLALLIGPSGYGWYTVYADGQAIATVGSPERPLPYPRPRLITVPLVTAADGSIVFALRYYRVGWVSQSLGRSSGPAGGMALLGARADLERQAELARLRARRAHAIPFVLGLAFLLVGAFQVFIYVSRYGPSLRPHLWVGLGSLALGANALLPTSWVAEALDNVPLIFRTHEAAGHLAVVFLLPFLWSVLNRPLGRLLRVYVGTHVALAGLLLLIPFPWTLATVWPRVAWTVPGIVAGLWVLIDAARKGNPEARILLGGAAVLVVALGVGITRGSGLDAPSNLPYAGLAVFLLGTTVALSNRFGRTHRQALALRRDLEQRLDVRTRELADAMRAADRANRAKSEFLANMSHELRTPLNSVIGFSNVLLRRSADFSERDRSFLERIRYSGEHLLELINDILDLSKIEAGRMDVVLEDTEVRELAEAVGDRFRDDAEVRGLALEVDVPAGVRPVSLDPRRIGKVLENLVGNALRFTERGFVRIRVETAGRRPVAIAVQDSGIGIPEDMRESIFEAFQQADTSTARRFQGTGLGLTISRSLCHLMGCRLEVESEAGVGTTFRIVLPVPLEAVSLPAVDEEEGAEQEGKLVLVIDDEADAQLLLEEHLRSFGCRVVTAASGPEGLQVARELHPDLVTLDLKMPGMDGWATLRAFKADPGLRDVPVVVVSVVASESRGTLLGHVDLVSKPVDRDALLEAVGRNLRGRTSRALVVDDDPDARHLLTALLEPSVDEVRTAENGADALRVLETYDPGVILLDLVMPEMDGMTFLHALRQDARHAEVPVLVVTSKNLSEAETRVLEGATGGVLRKDFEGGMGTDALKERLSVFLESTGRAN